MFQEIKKEPSEIDQFKTDNVEMFEEMPILKKEEDSSLVSKFTQLWFACYFERKLSRQKV